jgi:hypothetical protein
MKKVVKNKAVGQPHQGIPDISVEAAQSIVGISSKAGIKLNLTRILFFIEGGSLTVPQESLLSSSLPFRIC